MTIGCVSQIRMILGLIALAMRMPKTASFQTVNPMLDSPQTDNIERALIGINILDAIADYRSFKHEGGSRQCLRTF